jgi:hypothetical protein
MLLYIKAHFRFFLTMKVFRLLALIFGFAFEIDIACVHTGFRSISGVMSDCSTILSSSVSAMYIQLFFVLPIPNSGKNIQISREMPRRNSRMETLQLTN